MKTDLSHYPKLKETIYKTINEKTNQNTNMPLSDLLDLTTSIREFQLKDIDTNVIGKLLS